MPEHFQDTVHFAVVHLHIVINLARRSDPNAAVMLHFIASFWAELSNCQPHPVGKGDSVCKIEFPHTLPAW